jgi:hypothetical protein
MSEKFKMKNVASKTDRASFTVWIKTAFSRMTTPCAAAVARTIAKNHHGKPAALCEGDPCSTISSAFECGRHSSIGREQDPRVVVP